MSLFSFDADSLAAANALLTSGALFSPVSSSSGTSELVTTLESGRASSEPINAIVPSNEKCTVV